MTTLFLAIIVFIMGADASFGFTLITTLEDISNALKSKSPLKERNKSSIGLLTFEYGEYPKLLHISENT